VNYIREFNNFVFVNTYQTYKVYQTNKKVKVKTPFGYMTANKGDYVTIDSEGRQFVVTENELKSYFTEV
jgi:hypothetical protein